ncbi:MAG: hypothetical protein M1818_008170 [Claussenomyces sp. TS43310]|nr:MAG: hypothetical protein M1818_008170 [Claussenomyces sp. TS43310]
MGASESKPTPGPSHVWQSETPVRFSQDLVDSLQASTEEQALIPPRNPQTDSTRAKTLDLHIQARVAEELKRLQAREDQVLRDLEAKIAAEEERKPEKPGAGEPSSSSSAGDTLRDLGREAVQKDVRELRRKLEARKKVAEIADLDAGVDRARGEVISCLRNHDRRPLNCWEEVERFRDEVRKMEGAWVEKVVR